VSEIEKKRRGFLFRQADREENVGECEGGTERERELLCWLVMRRRRRRKMMNVP